MIYAIFSHINSESLKIIFFHFIYLSCNVFLNSENLPVKSKEGKEHLQRQALFLFLYTFLQISKNHRIVRIARDLWISPSSELPCCCERVRRAGFGDSFSSMSHLQATFTCSSSSTLHPGTHGQNGQTGQNPESGMSDAKMRFAPFLNWLCTTIAPWISLPEKEFPWSLGLWAVVVSAISQGFFQMYLPHQHFST